MALRFNTLVRNAAAAAIVSGLSVLDIYTGAQPASGETGASGVLLVRITGIVWAGGSNGTISVVGTPNGVALATGIAGWGRFHDPQDTHRMDGLVGAEFTLAATNIVADGTVTLTGATLSQPAG